MSNQIKTEAAVSEKTSSFKLDKFFIASSQSMLACQKRKPYNKTPNNSNQITTLLSRSNQIDNRTTKPDHLPI